MHRKTLIVQSILHDLSHGATECEAILDDLTHAATVLKSLVTEELKQDLYVIQWWENGST